MKEYHTRWGWVWEQSPGDNRDGAVLGYDILRAWSITTAQEGAVSNLYFANMYSLMGFALTRDRMLVWRDDGMNRMVCESELSEDGKRRAFTEISW